MAAALVALVVAGALPGTALADEAEALLEEGLVRLKVGKFKKALKVLKKARRKAKNPKIKARVMLNLGVVHAVMRKKKRARKAFKAALKLDATVALKQGDVKQKVFDLFEKVRSKIKGSIQVKVDPAGSAITLNGKALGKTPYTGDLPVGAYKVVVVSADGLSRFETDVVINKGDQSDVGGKLVFVGARLNVTSQPEGAKVLVDGKELGVTPLKDARLPAGEHEVVVSKEGFTPHKAKVKGAKGAAMALAVNLKSVTAPAPKPDQPVAQPTPVPPTPTPDKAKGRFPIWTMVTGGLAVAALGAGIGMGLVSNSAFDEYETTSSQTDYWDLRDKVSAMETGANVSFAVAGAMAVTSALIYLLWERHPSNREMQPEPTPEPDKKAPAAAAVRILPTPNGLVIQF